MRNGLLRHRRFLDAYRDLLWGMRYLLVPAILVTLALVIANAISISVRERRMEMAVMKVLGFRPLQILLLVLGESLLIGARRGFISAARHVVPGQQRLSAAFRSPSRSSPSS